MAPRSTRSNRKSAARYIVSLQGQKTEAVLLISINRRLLEEDEEPEDIRHFDEAIKIPTPKPWEKPKSSLAYRVET